VGTTAIIGGGVIGLLAAYELHRRGVDVTLIDKSDFGAACSTGNAGWITPSLSGPVPAPGLVATSLKWMMDRHSPLYIRPSSLPALAPWLFQFWRHCNAADYHAGLMATARLAEPVMDLYDSLVEHGVEFEMHDSGILFAVLNPEYLTHLAEDLKIMRQFGYGEPLELSGGELRDFEPEITDAVKGALWVREERHVRPETLTEGLVRWLTAEGVKLYPGVKVTGIRSGVSTVRAIETLDGTLDVDQILIAAGAWSGEVARMAGVTLPMQAGKGYNITVNEPELKLHHAIYFSDARVACSPFDGALRVSGTMELSGVNTAFDPRRVEAIRHGADRCLGDWSRGASETSWVGMRPLTPDGLPVIGRAPKLENLYLATGHSMLGITLGPSTALTIAELMTTGKSSIDLTAFDPARFAERTTVVRAI
jgi:D-amino-acid dehydrogenase